MVWWEVGEEEEESEEGKWVTDRGTGGEKGKVYIGEEIGEGRWEYY